MDMQIAVFLGTNDKTIAFNQSGITRLYLKDRWEWRIIKEVSFEIDDSMNFEIIRENIGNMAEELGKCRIFVASEVKGIPYVVLNDMGFNIWMAEGVPKDFLENICKQQEEKNLNEHKAESIPMPTPIKGGKEGAYFIDVKMEMRNNENLNTKQMLLPFIRNTTFNELEVICAHVPPWFEGEFEKLNLKSEIEQMKEGTVKVKVYPK